MKIYKLDIDASKPIRKVVQMQQNSTGALSVDVTNDGWPIRNLSCALYDGETELSAYATAESGAGYKIDMGADTKVVKLTAKSVPTECSAQFWVGGTGPTQTGFCSKVQLEAGTYRQDEFYTLAARFGSNDGMATIFSVHGDDLSNVNFIEIVFTPWVADTPVWFRTSGGEVLPQDELIIATGPVSIGKNEAKKRTSTLSSFTYPAVGYWTDYSLDTVIRPSENAHCYAEQEVTDPEPEPTPDPEPDPEPTPGE